MSEIVAAADEAASDTLAEADRTVSVAAWRGDRVSV